MDIENIQVLLQYGFRTWKIGSWKQFLDWGLESTCSIKFVLAIVSPQSGLEMPISTGMYLIFYGFSQSLTQSSYIRNTFDLDQGQTLNATSKKKKHMSRFELIFFTSVFRLLHKWAKHNIARILAFWKWIEETILLALYLWRINAQEEYVAFYCSRVTLCALLFLVSMAILSWLYKRKARYKYNKKVLKFTHYSKSIL